MHKSNEQGEHTRRMHEANARGVCSRLQPVQRVHLSYRDGSRVWRNLSKLATRWQLGLLQKAWCFRHGVLDIEVRNLTGWVGRLGSREILNFFCSLVFDPKSSGFQSLEFGFLTRKVSSFFLPNFGCQENESDH